MGKKSKRKKERRERFFEDPAFPVLRGAVWVGIFLALLSPLVFDTEMYFPFNAPKTFLFMAAVQIAFFAWLILAIHDKKYRPGKNPVLGLMIFFLGSLTLSSIFGLDFSMSFWSNQERTMGLLSYFHLFAFFLVLLSFLKTEKEWFKVLGFSVAASAIVGLVGLLDTLEIVVLSDIFRQGSFLGNTSFMGTYLLINGFFALYLLLRSTEKESLKILTFLSLSLFFLFAISLEIFFPVPVNAISVLGSLVFFIVLGYVIFEGNPSIDRTNLILFISLLFIVSFGVVFNPGGRAMKGAFVAGIAFLPLLFAAFGKSVKMPIRSTAKIFLAIGLVSAVFIGFSAFQEGSAVRERIIEFRGMPARFLVWEKALAGLEENPVLGLGLENFDKAFLRNFNPKMFLGDYGGEVWFDRAHNVVFDQLVATGILGTIAFFSLLGFSLFFLWKKYAESESMSFWTPAIFTSLLTAHFIQGLTVFDMITAHMLIFLSFAFIAFNVSPPEEEERQGTVFNRSSLVLLIPLAASLFFFTIQPYRTNIHTIKAFKEYFGSDRKMEYYEKALKFSPMGRNQIRLHMAERIVNNLNAEINEIKRIMEEARNPEEKEAIGKELERRKENIRGEFIFLMEEVEKNTRNPASTFRDHWMLARLHSAYFDFYYLDLFSQEILKGEGLAGEEAEALIAEAREFVARSEEISRKGIELSPRNQQGYWQLAGVYINYGKIHLILSEKEEAEEEFRKALLPIEEAISLEPLLIGSHIKAIDVANKLLMDEDLLEDFVGRAMEVDPSWEELIRNYLGS